MPSRKPASAAQQLKRRVSDNVRFLRNWVERPLTVGAVAPSSPQLADRMAACIDPAIDGPVLELGPGTGVVTEALIRRGIAPERIVSIEYGEEFVGFLRRRMPAVRFIHGDAYALRRLLVDAEKNPFAATISSLPLFTRPLPQRVALIADALALSRPGAPFVQFSYALVPPVPNGMAALRVTASPWVVRNLPPARVFTYRASEI